MMRAATWAVCASAILFSSKGAASSEVDFGRRLFQGFENFSTSKEVTNSGRPTDLIACSTCHGAQAQGKREGGISFPSLQWQTLTAPSDGLGAYADEAALQEAFTKGIGRDGKILSSVMPRYQLTATEAGAITQYLQIVGKPNDLPRGVSSNTIRLGVMVPLTGPSRQTGSDLLTGITTAFTALNREGGVHGRRIELISRDSHPDSYAAANELLTLQVYAVVGSLWQRDPRVEALFAKQQIAMIANFTPRLQRQEISSWSFDLLPPLDEQQAKLNQDMIACNTDAQRLIFQSPLGLILNSNLAAKVVTNEDELADGISSSSSSSGCIGYSLSDASKVQNLIPASWQQRIVLPFPELLTRQGSADVSKALGTAAARIMIELLATSGSQLHERSVLDSLDVLDGFEPLPGMPIKYQKARRFAWQPGIIEIEKKQAEETNTAQ